MTVKNKPTSEIQSIPAPRPRSAPPPIVIAPPTPPYRNEQDSSETKE